ncbi:hypothetical protein B0H14DRAFT_1162808 [Mycena olivaceomarginata]|nr:hypothetical protein B0H14DRAFT_1162808 [Mycena olivaceomarginata]
MLNHLNMMMNRGLTPLMLRLPEILSGMDDHELHGRFITTAFEARQFYTLPNPEITAEVAIEHFRLIQDLDGEVRLLLAIAAYYHDCANDVKTAEDFYSRALRVALQSNSDTAKAQTLGTMAVIEWDRSNYSRALHLAQETYRIGRASGSVRGELNGIRLQALCFSARGDFKRAMQLLVEGKNLVVRAGLQGGQMENLLMAIEANLYELKTEYLDARCIQEAILRRISPVLSPMEHGYALVNIAGLDIVTGASADTVSRNLDAATTSFRNAQYLRAHPILRVLPCGLAASGGRCDRGQSGVYAAYCHVRHLQRACVLVPWEAGGSYNQHRMRAMGHRLSCSRITPTGAKSADGTPGIAAPWRRARAAR